MRAKTIFPSGIIAIALVCSAGCDSKETKGAAFYPPTSAPGPTAPAPGNAPAPVPEPTPELTTVAGKLNVVAAFPGPDEPQVALVSPISVELDEGLIQGADLTNAIRVQSPTGTVAGSITQEASNTLVFRPTNLWTPDTAYSVAMDSGLMSATGLTINTDATWQFTTVPDLYMTPQAVIDECMSDLDMEMLAAVNQARIVARSCGENPRPAVGKLIWNCRLQQAAIVHSEDMANNDFFSHTGSDGSNAGDRITRTGYVWSHAGENLAAGYHTVGTAMAGLLRSPDHCDNIMSSHYTEFGSAYRTNSDSSLQRYWTQNFGRAFRF
jgi:uncharacterized protein YkwD